MFQSVHTVVIDRAGLILTISVSKLNLITAHCDASNHQVAVRESDNTYTVNILDTSDWMIMCIILVGRLDQHKVACVYKCRLNTDKLRRCNNLKQRKYGGYYI
jgi:hypothetical protein